MFTKSWFVNIWEGICAFEDLIKAYMFA